MQRRERESLRLILVSGCAGAEDWRAGRAEATGGTREEAAGVQLKKG
jgi:hypothetical protein